MIVSQTEFRGALLEPDRARPLGLVDDKGRAAGARFDVYRNNVASSLTEALEAGFPAIEKLLGAENFHAIAGVFLRQAPPASPLMMHYGVGFPEFLASFEPLQHLGYLGDVARLELALRRAYHAEDATPIAPDALGSLPPERLGDVVMTFAPAVELLRSAWPIQSILAFNLNDGPKPAAVAQDVLITRADFDPAPDVLPAGGHTAMTVLMAGQTLGEAVAQATEDAAEFDLGALLAVLLQGNAITSLTITP